MSTKRKLPVYPASRPKFRSRCAPGKMPRPCPFVSCEHHMAIDVNPVSGEVVRNFPGVPIEKMRWTCWLDAAESGLAPGRAA